MKRLRAPAWSVLLAVCILLVFILWAAFFRTVEQVDSVGIQRGDVEASVSALGTLQPHRYVDVGAQASGEIRRIHVRAGDTVQKGQVLVEIDPSVQQAKLNVDRSALASLRAQLTAQEAQHELARQQYERQRIMTADGSTRDADLQLAYATLAAARAGIDNLHAQIDGAQSTLKGDDAQLGYTRIFAPMSGTVVTLDAREGQTLNATYQTPVILRIADLSTMTVYTQVSEADVMRVTQGMPVYFTTLGAPGRRWASHVNQVLPAPPNAATDGQPAGSGSGSASQNQNAGKVVLYMVLFDVANTDRQLMPQMSAEVFFVTARAKNAIVAPVPAMKPVDGRAGVYRAQVVVDGKVTGREVHTGVNDRLNAEVLSGLKEGDHLVTAIRRTRAADGRIQW